MHRAASLSGLSIGVLLERGTLLLKQEKFQDVIACFKHLLKLEQRVEFLQGLEQAYLGRIKALAAKSMIKEAIALLAPLVHRWPDVRADPLRLSILLLAGNGVKLEDFEADSPIVRFYPKALAAAPSMFRWSNYRTMWSRLLQATATINWGETISMP